MNERKRAGHVSSPRLSNMFDGCLVLIGFLAKDKRGTDHRGYTRDFSGQELRTSYIERLEYNIQVDTTVVFTRNSIYFAPGNLILDQLNLETSYAEGTEDIRAAFDKYAVEKIEILQAEEAIAEKRGRDIATHELTQKGVDMSGEELGALLVVNSNFTHTNYCGSGETPYCLAKDFPGSLLQTIFLTKDMVKEL